MLALTDPFPVLIGLCLAVAVYMFAAIKFPALRFMFRLKRGAAWAAGVDDDANRRVGETLGLVLCPLIGVGALLACGWLLIEWKQEKAAAEHHQAAREAATGRLQEEASTVLREWQVQTATFGRFDKFGPGEEGMEVLEGFVTRLGEAFSSDCVPGGPGDPELGRNRECWKVELKPAGDEPGLAVLMLDPEHEAMRLAVSQRSDRYPSGGFELVAPEAVRDAWDDLRALEKVDLAARERERRRAEAEEARRLSDYREKSFEGPPAHEIHDAVMELPEDQREAKKAEFVGMTIDWEVKLMVVDEENGVLAVKASQSRPGPGRSWIIAFEAPRDLLPEIEARPRFQFARVKGVIDSLDQGIGLKLESLERFQP